MLINGMHADMIDELSTEEIAIRSAALAGYGAMRRAGATVEDSIHCLCGLALHLVGDLPAHERDGHFDAIREMTDWVQEQMHAEDELENKRSS